MTTDRRQEEIEFQNGYDRAAYGVCREDLDKMGERTVRDNLNSGKYGKAKDDAFLYVSAWLADREFLRTEQATTRANLALFISIVTAIISVILLILKFVPLS